MISANDELASEIKSLLLPFLPDQEERPLQALKEILIDHGVAQEDFFIFVRLEAEKWEENGAPSSEFKSAIAAAIFHSSGISCEKISEVYFDIHAILKERHLMPHEMASAFLSHAFLIASLAVREKMSAAQIAIVMSARDARVDFNRQSIRDFLLKIDEAPKIESSFVIDLHNADADKEQAYFSDSSLEDCLNRISVVAERLGFPGDISALLDTLYKNEETDYIPYVQIVHYQMVIAEAYDHALTDFYEFLPRGKTAKTLFDLYPNVLVNAGNPFLNNAKSVDRVSEGWARSKKPKEFPGALALYKILSGMERLGFSAKRELAELVRMWIERLIRLASSSGVTISEDIDRTEIENFESHLACRQTQTRGVLEQRYVDAWCMAKYSSYPDIAYRGIGDSVNTTNISRRKLGDCDFQDSNHKIVYAYEAHGGNLTSIYYDEHMRTFEKILEERKKEWEVYADSEGWCVELIFVCHEYDGLNELHICIQGVNVKVIKIRFSELIREMSLSRRQGVFQNFFIEPLNRRHVPEFIKQVAMQNFQNNNS